MLKASWQDLCSVYAVPSHREVTGSYGQALNHYVKGLTPSRVRGELTLCSLIFVTSCEGNEGTHLRTDSIRSHEMRTFSCFFFLLTLFLFILWKILYMYTMYLSRYLFLLFLFMFMYVSVWVDGCARRPKEDFQYLVCSWSYEQLWAAQCGCWELDLGSLQ